MERQASTTIFQSPIPNEVDEDNEERLKNTPMDTEEKTSTLPQPQLAESFKAEHPKALLETWIVYSEITKAEKGEAMDDVHCLIALPSYVHGGSRNLKNLGRNLLGL
ncbi:hypothetical protein TorRG33x02_242090 [Trema orientale]|uniref:Uncharacterized protein n=1 Tax=Trema orientale TaxID=63057 RepID=A0A2P5DU03_TREOI|nr:hypothetical protein TorRG33x02_242090 [Trema orientale]